MRDDSPHFGCRDVPRSGELFNRVPDPGGLIALSTIGNGRKVRRIRFSKYPIIGHEPEQIVVDPFPERHDTAERHIPAVLDRLFRKLVGSGVAMKNSFHALRACLGDHCAGVIFGIASVHDDGFACLARQLELRGESAPLLEPRGIIVMIVEPAFADGDSAVGENIAKRVQVLKWIEPDCVVRMNTGCVPDEARVRFGDCPRRASGAEDVLGAASRADADDGLGSVLFRALDYRVAVAVERRVGEVRVAVDVPFDIPVFLGHLRSIHRSVGPAM